MADNPGIQSFDYSVDPLQAVLWQYDASPNILALMQAKQAWYDRYQTQFWIDFYNRTFNLATANLFGLSIWAYILELPLLVPTDPDPVDKPMWGFNEYDPSFPTLINTNENFEHGNFSSQTSQYVLTEEEQRLILQIRAYQITSSGNIWDINAFFQYLFTNNIYFAGKMITVLDGLDMSITYVFNWYPSYGLRKMLVDYDLLPRPAGVGIKYVIATGIYFGFNAYDPSFPTLENTNQNFENGGFAPTSFV